MWIHMDQQILNKNIQVVDGSWDFTLNKNQPKPNQTLFIVTSKNQQKVYHPNKFNALKNVGNLCFSSGKNPHSPGFFCFSRNASPQRNDHPTPRASPKPFCRLSGDGLVLAKAQASIVEGPEELGSVAFVGWFWWVEKNQPTPSLKHICEFGQNWDGI